MVTTLARTPPEAGASAKSQRRWHDALFTVTTATNHQQHSNQSIRKFVRRPPEQVFSEVPAARTRNQNKLSAHVTVFQLSVDNSDYLESAFGMNDCSGSRFSVKTYKKSLQGMTT